MLPCVTYPLFQVETIGDSLLVVSGLPVPNGDRHAREIADMALDIISFVTHFKIRHRPRMKLQLRVGLHSGKLLKIWRTGTGRQRQAGRQTDR